MISKRAFIKPKNDNYARLAEYIAAADHEGESCFTAGARAVLAERIMPRA
jgi:hypothetical protein